VSDGIKSTNGASGANVANGNGKNGKRSALGDAPTREAIRLAMTDNAAPAGGSAPAAAAARFHPAFAAARPTPAMQERIAAITTRRVVTAPRWEPVRAIVQNYFVIPYQEFHFVNGCLVLGGANSTGKTSVLTSLVTLVLDNDKRPQRFDPSGARVRSIGYYVLGKPEMRFYHKNRISYIALEFRHTGTGEYRTVGIGLQGHRAGNDGQPQIDGWGFLLADGRRIGPDHDISLFDESGEKRVPLSRARLVKALGADVNTVNRVVDDIDSYRDMVNAALFGFKSAQQYTDLVSILTSLRASKLANTIKPSAVSGFLQHSLRPLDEALMEDAGRIYERIDQYQERLELLLSQVVVLDDLAKAEASWRLAAARREAGLYRDAYRDADRALKRLERVRDDIVREQKAVDDAETSITDERTKKERKTARLKVLERKDELKDIAKLTEYKDRLAESNELAERAQTAANEARGRRDDAAGRARDLLAAWTEAVDDVIKRAKDLAQEARSSWATAESFAAAITTSARQATVGAPVIAPSVSLNALRADHEVQRDSLQDIRKALDVADQAEFKHQTARDHREVVAGELTIASDALQQRRDEERAGRSRAADALRVWVDASHADVPIAADTVEQVVEQILDADLDPDGLTDLFHSAIDGARTTLRADEAAAVAAREAGRQRVEEMEARLHEKEQEHEETPPQPAERIRAREAIAATSIGALPLYQAVDFGPKVTNAEGGRLERILEDAGLLDALLVRASDRDRARAVVAVLPGGEQLAASEVWLADAPRETTPMSGRTLADYLVTANGDAIATFGDGSAATVVAALRSIRVFEDSTALRSQASHGGSAIALDGGWMHGTLSGHTTAERPRGRYIGLANRQRARAEAIAQLKAALAEATDAHERLIKEAARITEQLRAVAEHERALRALPSLRALPTLRSQVESADQDVVRCEERLAAAEQRVAKARASVTEAKHQVDLACRAIQWTGERSKDAIERAMNTLQRLRESAGAIHQQIETTHRVAKDHAETINRMPGLKDAAATASRYVAERQLAVARDAARVQAIQDLLKRADIQALTREVGELEYDIKKHVEEIERVKTIRDKAETLVESAREDLPEREAAANAARGKAGSHLDNFAAALTVHPVTATEASQARVSDAAAAGVAEQMLKPLSSAESGPVALDNAREGAFNAMDRIRAQHTAVLTLLQPAVDREAGYTFVHHGRQLTTNLLLAEIADEQVKLEATLGEDQRTLAQKFMSEEILSAIHTSIQDTHEMIHLVNAKLGQIKSTKSKQLRFVWRPITLPGMTTNVTEVAKLLGTKVTYWSDEDRAMLVRFIEERLAYVRTRVKADDASTSYVEALKDALDYRNWYAFTMETFGKRWAEFTDKEFGEGSEGEKAVDMLAPLFAVVHARYANAALDAPRLIGMDEAMAGLDASNTRGLFALLADFEYAFVMTSEKLWGVSENLSGCATYQLQVDNPKDPSVFAATMFLWDGVERTEDDIRVITVGVAPTTVAGTQGELVL